MGELISIFMNVVKNNFFNLKGRARRKEFWMFFLAFMIIYVIIIVVGTILSMISATLGSIVMGICGLLLLILCIPALALGARRMHDVGKSGWFYFIPIYSLILAITEGEKGNNQYGEDPKAGM